MSETMTQTEDQTASHQDELSLLKQRARIMGVEFSNNIGLDTLRERIRAKMDSEPTKAEDPQVAQSNPLVGDIKPVEKVLSVSEQIRADLLREELKLIRVRITNLDPKKKDMPGEIFTVANEFIGTVRKYIPYGEVTDEGYHIPQIIFRQLDARKFLNIRTTKNRTNGQTSVTHSWAKEFALDILPPLTREELTALATAQTAAGIFASE